MVRIGNGVVGWFGMKILTGRYDPGCATRFAQDLVAAIAARRDTPGPRNANFEVGREQFRKPEIKVQSALFRRGRQDG